MSLPGAKGLEPAIVKYVVSEERPQVLTDLAAARQQHYFGYHIDADQLRPLFVDFDDVEPEVWLRWGRVLEASLGSNQWSTPLAVAGVIPAWLEQLLVSLATAYGPRGYGGAVTPPAPVPVSFATLGAVAEAGGVDVAQLLDSLFVATSGMAYSSSSHTPPGRRRDVRLPRGPRRSARPGVRAAHQRRGRAAHPVLHPGLRVPRRTALGAGAPSRGRRHVDQHQGPRGRPAAAAPGAAVRGAGAPGGLAVEGKPDVRGLALELLWHHGGEPDRAFARETAAADRTPRIRALVDGWDGATAADSAELPPELEVPAPPPVDWRVELDDAMRDAGAPDRRVAQPERRRAQPAERPGADGLPGPMGQPAPGDLAGDPDRRRPGEAAARRAGAPHGHPPTEKQSNVWQLGQSAGYFAALPEATPVAVVKVLARLGFLVDQRPRLTTDAVNALEACHARNGGPDLLSLQQMLDEMGLPGRQLVWRSITASWQTLAREWPEEHVWPFLARNIDFVRRPLPARGR